MKGFIIRANQIVNRFAYISMQTGLLLRGHYRVMRHGVIVSLFFFPSLPLSVALAANNADIEHEICPRFSDNWHIASQAGRIYCPSTSIGGIPLSCMRARVCV